MAQPTEPTNVIAGCPEGFGFALTSHALNDGSLCADRLVACEARCAAYVTKPSNRSQLLATIRHQLALAAT